MRAYIRYREKNPDAKELLVLAGSTYDEYVVSFGKLPTSAYASDIKFIGYVETADMPSVYCGSAALSFVTLNEGFGMPILEAWACKVPVITSNVTAMPEVAGNAAIVVDPHNPEALADALALVRKPDVRAKLIERGFARSRFFTMEMSVAGTKAMYHQLLDFHPPLRYDRVPTMPMTLPYDMRSLL